MTGWQGVAGSGSGSSDSLNERDYCDAQGSKFTIDVDVLNMLL